MTLLRRYTAVSVFFQSSSVFWKSRTVHKQIRDLKMYGKIIEYANDNRAIFSGTTWRSVYQKPENKQTKSCWFLNSKKLILNINETFIMAISINKENIPFDEMIAHYCVNE